MIIGDCFISLEWIFSLPIIGAFIESMFTTSDEWEKRNLAVEKANLDELLNMEE